MENPKEIKVSIILPIYNAGKHLYKCLDSLVNQTLQDIEIIAILDCPTDGSDKVVEDYAKKYPQIRIIKNEQNLHIGNSRNKGLEIAKGKYIGFCDHDDYADLQMYEKLYTIMEKEGVDMVVSPYVGVINGEIRINNYYPIGYSPAQYRDAIFKTTIGITSISDPMRRFAHSGVIWNKLFKKSIIDQNQIRFIDTKIITPEDLLFYMEYISYCKTIEVCQTNLYFHQLQINNTGSSYAYSSSQKRLNALIRLYNFLKNGGYLEDPDTKKRFDNTIRSISFMPFIVELKQKGLKAFIEALKLYKKQAFIKQAFRLTDRTIFREGNSLKKELFLLFCKLYK